MNSSILNQRNEIIDAQKRLMALNKERLLLIKKIDQITENCEHKIGIILKQKDEFNKMNIGYCVGCHSFYRTPYPIKDFKYPIYFEEDDISEDQKIALVIFKIAKYEQENAEITEEQIAHLINNEINEHKPIKIVNINRARQLNYLYK